MNFENISEKSYYDLITDFSTNPKRSMEQFVSNYLSIIKISGEFCEFSFEGDFFECLKTNDENILTVRSNNEEFNYFIKWYNSKGYERLLKRYNQVDDLIFDGIREKFKPMFDYSMIKFDRALEEKNFYLMFDALLSSLNYVEKSFDEYLSKRPKNDYLECIMNLISNRTDKQIINEQMDKFKFTIKNNSDIMIENCFFYWRG